MTVFITKHYSSQYAQFIVMCVVLMMSWPSLGLSAPERLREQALNYHRAGQLKQARAVYRKILKQRQRTQSKHPLQIVKSLADLAQVEIDRGKFDEAEHWLRQALYLISDHQIDDSVVVAKIYQIQGTHAYYQGRYQQAFEWYTKALRRHQILFTNNHPLVAESLNGLAMVHYAQQDYQAAQQLLHQAHAIYVNSNASATLAGATVLNNLGLVTQARADSTTAINHLQQALLIQRHILPDHHPSIAETLHNLASVYFDQGLYPQATKLLKSSLDVTQSNSQQGYPSKAHTLDMLSVINSILGRYEIALKYARRATRIYFKRITSNTPRPLLSGSFSEHRSIRFLFEHHIEALIELKKYRNKPDDQSYQKELFRQMQLAHISTSGHALLARYVQSTGINHTGTLTTVSINETQLLLADDEAVLLYYLGVNHGYLMLVSQQTIRFQQLDLNQQTIHRWLQPLFASLKNPAATRISEIRTFDLDSALMLYRKLIEPVANDLDTIKHLLVIKDPEFEQLPFPLLVTTPSDIDIQRFTQFSGYRSVDWLIKHYAVSELPGVRALSVLRATNTTQRPNKPLIAFGAPDLSVDVKIHHNISQSTRKNKQTLIRPNQHDSVSTGNTAKKRYNVSQSTPRNQLSEIRLERDQYRPSNQTILKPRYNLSQSTPQSSVSLVPTRATSTLSINRRELRQLPKLNNAASELKQLANLLNVSESVVITGKQATESRLKETTLSDYQILAFATHGLTAQQSARLNGPAQAALLLTPPETPTEFDDGLLIAEEIAQLDLNADWVILSACNTGVNDPVSLTGLARAFFLAGSRSLLVSYWNLESRAARELNIGLFKQIADKPHIRRAEALRQSMLKFLQPGMQTYYAHPYFWAPFTIIGEGGSLDSSHINISH